MFRKNGYKQYARSKSLMRRPVDQILLLIVLIMVGIGCFFIYDLTAVGAAVQSRNYYLTKQIVYAVSGFCYLWVLSRIDYHYLDSMTIPLLIVVVVLHFLVSIAGSSGYIQWHAPYLTFGEASIPVGQITELAGILILAGFLARIDLGGVRALSSVCGSIFIGALPLASFDIKNALVLSTTACFLLSLIDLQFVLVTIALVVVLYLGCSAVVPVLEPVFSVWLDPFSDPQGRGFAYVQSIYSIADGGILGVGVGNGTMRYVIEDTYSTFMLPAITQEIGALGAVMIFLIYLSFLNCVFTIAAKAVDRFGFYLAAAIMMRFSVLFVLVLLTSVNLIPQLRNLTLPFLSYGGISLLTDFLLVGVLLSIGRYQTESGRR